MSPDVLVCADDPVDRTSHVDSNRRRKLLLLLLLLRMWNVTVPGAYPAARRLGVSPRSRRLRKL